mmetsp:Transcript_86346/g.144102  ORF Transcript_86346/g.144102 Transcript_86346/m.144102 type:complete len:87 (-) Transcript_86346:4158-4418(-)
MSLITALKHPTHIGTPKYTTSVHKNQRHLCAHTITNMQHMQTENVNKTLLPCNHNRQSASDQLEWVYIPINSRPDVQDLVTAGQAI